jgi:hypothetical protein
MAKEQWDSREVVTGDLRRSDCSCFLNASVTRFTKVEEAKWITEYTYR